MIVTPGGGGDEVDRQSVIEEEPVDAQDVPATTSPSPYPPDQQDEGVLTLEPPRPPTPKEVLQPLDITPFLRTSELGPRIKDAEEEARQLSERQAQIAAYRAYRAEVEARRQQDRQARNQAKIAQLQLAEDLQAKLDAARAAVNAPREAYRQRFLEAERKRLEQLANAEAALNADTAPSPKGKKSPVKSAKGKKKK